MAIALFCTADTPGAVLVTPPGKAARVWALVHFAGCVLQVIDGWMGHVVVWLGDHTGKVAFAGGFAEVDATPEVHLAHRAWHEAQINWHNKDRERSALKGVRRGMQVRVVSGRKVPVGTEGECFWIGETPFQDAGGRTQYRERVGIRVAGVKEPFWTDLSNVENAAPLPDLPPAPKEQETLATLPAGLPDPVEAVGRSIRAGLSIFHSADTESTPTPLAGIGRSMRLVPESVLPDPVVATAVVHTDDGAAPLGAARRLTFRVRSGG